VPKWLRILLRIGVGLVGLVILENSIAGIPNSITSQVHWLNASSDDSAIRAGGLVVALVLGLVAVGPEKLRKWADEIRPNGGPKKAPSAPSSTPNDVATPSEAPIAPADVPAKQASQRIFDEAPPELAEMSSDSLKELLAGRTEAQIDALMAPHVGKPVRVSGEVARVEIRHIGPRPIPHVSLRHAPGAVGLLVFFDGEDYDAVPLVLALNQGDQIVASGLIYRIRETTVIVDNCELIETRRVADKP
jgi:hypothetical protein